LLISEKKIICYTSILPCIYINISQFARLEAEIQYIAVYEINTLDFIFMGPCIVRYQGGIYDQQDATNSQYFIVIITLHVSGHHCPSSGVRDNGGTHDDLNGIWLNVYGN
jgi:hypothetical protein